MVNQVEFWQQRWLNNQTGFHEGQVNEYLEKYLSQLSLNNKASLFLPLCGKSHDIIWLTKQGYNVIGVECSELAVKAFFEENNLSANIKQHNNFTIWQANTITIYCGDFYQLESIWFDSVSAIFDRAALIALPVEQRQSYINQIIKLCPNAAVLLVSLEYQQNEMDGPPFAVSEQEINNLFKNHYNLNKLLANDILAENDKFKERGLHSLYEKVFLAKPK